MNSKNKKISFSMFLVTIGIVYGDIGTSPLYVMKSIIEGNGGYGEISEELIIGALSLIIWTVTLLTTIKYVIIALKADNNGEGGIFALYSLVKKYGKWLIVPAMIGGSALLADGVLTPAVTVTTAVEGLRSISVMNKLLGSGQVKIIIITLVIIAALFIAQQAGTSKIGKAFGPCMLIWFAFLAFGGLLNIGLAPAVLKAINPLYAIKILFSPYNKKGFMILGSIFLAATGAEALYSDMGHVGKESIYFSWPFVKICLIINYFGQGAWIIANVGNPAFSKEVVNPFYMMLPESLRPVAILLSAMAAIIASQALITGSYSLVSEAINLNLLPHLGIKYPSETKGQLYIPMVNNILWIGCSLVVMYFKSGSAIEAAYGLAITVTMLMTTLLLSVYLYKVENKAYIALPVLIIFGAIEAIFFISSLSKFPDGGYVTVIIAFLIFCIMYIWRKGTKLEDRNKLRLRASDYIKEVDDLRKDDQIPMVADNIVYIENESDIQFIDRDILYSILDKNPKRAKAYWFINVQVTDKPGDMQYSVENFGTDFFYCITMKLGYKVDQAINVYFRQIVGEMLEKEELPKQNRIHSIYGPSDIGTFKFCIIQRTIPSKTTLSKRDEMVLKTKYAIRKLCGSREKWFGLDTGSQIIEKVPLFVSTKQMNKLTRVN